MVVEYQTKPRVKAAEVGAQDILRVVVRS